MDSQVESSAEYQALSQHLSNNDIASAVRELTSPTAEAWQKGDNDDIEKKLWTAWNAVITYAANTPDNQQDALVSVLQNVHELGPLTREDQVCRVWEAIVWTDMPVFTAAMREAWTPATDPEGSMRWHNLNAFAARLAASASRPGSTFDLSLYAIWTLRDALEPAAVSSKNFTSIPSSSLDAAAMWMVYCAPKLLQQSLDGRDFEGKRARAGDAYANEEWTGFNMERWNRWKETFRDLIGAEEQRGVNELAKKAVSSMESAEQESSMADH